MIPPLRSNGILLFFLFYVIKPCRVYYRRGRPRPWTYPANSPHLARWDGLGSFRHFFARTGGRTGIAGMTTANSLPGLRESSKVVISAGPDMAGARGRRKGR